MKKTVSVLTAILMVLCLLAGCGESPGSSAGSGNTAESSAVTANTDSFESAADSSTAEATGETAKVKMLFLAFGSTPGDLGKVQGALNEQLREKINVEVSLEVINAGNYATQINLMLTSNEEMDLFVTGNLGALLTYSSQAPQGKLHELDSLLEEHGTCGIWPTPQTS